MKKILFFISFLFLSLLALAQPTQQANPFPNFQQFGSTSTMTKFNGISYAAYGNIWAEWPDTATANLSTIKDAPGIAIRVGDTYYFRNAAVTAWIPFGTGSGGNQDLQSVTAIGDSTIYNLITNDSIRSTYSWNHGFAVIGDTVRGNLSAIFGGNSVMVGEQLTLPTLQRWSYLVSKKYGWAEINRGITGTTAHHYATGDSCSLDRLWIIPTYSGSTYAALFNGWGINDANNTFSGDTAVYRAALITWVDTAIARGWPLNRIIITGPTYVDNASYTAIENFAICAQNVASDLGIIGIDLYHYMESTGGLSWLFADQIHPNAKGHDEISAYISTQLPYLHVGELVINGGLWIKDSARVNNFIRIADNSLTYSGSSFNLINGGTSFFLSTINIGSTTSKSSKINEQVSTNQSGLAVWESSTTNQTDIYSYGLKSTNGTTITGYYNDRINMLAGIGLLFTGSGGNNYMYVGRNGGTEFALGSALTLSLDSAIKTQSLRVWRGIRADGLPAGGTAADSVLVVNSTGTVYKRNAASVGGNGIYGGSGTLPSSVTVSGSSNTRSLILDNLDSFRVNRNSVMRFLVSSTVSYVLSPTLGRGNLTINDTRSQLIQSTASVTVEADSIVLANSTHDYRLRSLSTTLPDTTTYKVLAIGPDNKIVKTNWAYAGTGSGSGLFPTSGTGTATGAVTGDLDGNSLTIQNTDGFIVSSETATRLDLGSSSSIIYSPDGSSLFSIISNSIASIGNASDVIQIYQSGRIELHTLGDFRIDDASLASASNGYVWTLQDDATGEGAWTAAPAASLGIGGSITSGTANRVLFEDGSNQLAESGAFTFATSTLGLGASGTGTGVLNLLGTTSGTVSLTVAAAAGTHTIKLPIADGTNGQFLKTDGSGQWSFATVSASPAGSNTEIQFNNSGAFGASSNLTWDGTTLFGKESATATVPAFSVTTDVNTGFGVLSGNLNHAHVISNGVAEVLWNTTEMRLARDYKLDWSGSAGGAYAGGADVGISRSSAGLLQINSGTAGTYRDLIMRKLNIATGANMNIGTATLSGGTVTVNTTQVTASSIIFVTYNTPSGTQGFLSVPAASISASTSFVINSSSGTDASTVNWWIVN